MNESDREFSVVMGLHRLLSVLGLIYISNMGNMIVVTDGRGHVGRIWNEKSEEEVKEIQGQA